MTTRHGAYGLRLCRAVNLKASHLAMLLRGLLGKGDVLSMADGSATKKRKQAPGAVQAGPRLSRASARPSQEALQLEVDPPGREKGKAQSGAAELETRNWEPNHPAMSLRPA